MRIVYSPNVHTMAATAVTSPAFMPTTVVQFIVRPCSGSARLE